MSGDKNWAVTDTDSSGLFMSVAGFNSTGTIENPPGVIGKTATFKNRKTARAYGASRIEAGDIARYKLVRLVPQRENESWVVVDTSCKLGAWGGADEATAVVTDRKWYKLAVFDSRAKARRFRDERNMEARQFRSNTSDYKVQKYVA